MMGLDELSAGELSLAQPNPVVLALNKLHNQLKEKEMELGMAQSEIKALRAADVVKEKAVEELDNELNKLNEKFRITESLLEQKNLDIKRLTNEKKDAYAGQFAAESALRRVYTNQKDDDSTPMESFIAPLEADIKMYKNEIAILQEDKKTLERHTKSKEAALLEAQRILKSALERALIVEDVQNQNFELRRQIEICLEESKILEKTNRQKIWEVEKLSETIKELEEAILAGGAAANAVRDYRRQISELHEEKRTLERELARVKVSVNRVATVVANEWKDENEKVMPVKRWLDERKLLQAETQRLKDKLAISERTVKSEAQMKDKMKLRLTTLEEGLKHVANLSGNSGSFCGSSKPGKSNQFFGILSQKAVFENEISNPSGKIKGMSSLKKKYISGENLLIKSLWASKSKVVDETKGGENEEFETMGSSMPIDDDVVSGFLYDRLQKEVINLRKSPEVKDSSLNAKDQEIKKLVKKVDTLSKSFEVESKKMKARIKENVSTSAKDTGNKKITF